MSESGVIKEFLVAIGYKHDEAGAQKFGESIGSMTKLTLGLGAALESMAATAMFAAQRIAMSYSNLQTESRNVGASAENIKTYTYAVSQLGGTVEEALGSIQSFARKLQESPGQVAWLESFIGKARDAKGQLLDTTELIDKFVHSQRFQRAEEWQKRKFAENAGIDLNTWKALNDPNARQFVEESRRVDQDYGLDPNKLAKQGREFTNEWQAIWLRIRAIRDRFLMEIGFEEPLKRFKEWLDANHEGITRNLTAFVEAVKPFVKAFTEAATKVAEFAGAILKWLGPNTTAWLAIAALVVKFTGFGTALTFAIGLVGRLATALGALMLGGSGAAIKALGGLAGFFGAPAVAALLGGAAALYPTPAGEGEDEQQRQENVKKDPDYYKPGHPGAAPEKKKSRWERTKDWLGEKVGIKAQARETAEGQKGGETPARGKLADNQQEAYRAARAEGLSDAAARSLVANMTGESLHKPRDHHWDVRHMSQGIVQWDPERAEAIRRHFGRYPKDMSVAEQTRAAIWEIRNNPRFARTKKALEDGQSPNEMIDALVRNYEKPRDKAQAIAERRRHYRSLRVNAAADTEDQHSNAARRMADARRSARRPEVEPQTPIHIPERRRSREDEQWDNRPRYDRSRPGAPLVTPRARHDGGTGIARPGGVSPRTPLGHVSNSNRVRHGDVNAKTTINVSTPGDPGAAARAVAGIQNNVNADLVRNMRGAAR